MTKRKTIPKKTRFEVFKRDKFTCQYRGKSAPDVVLEIDHIIPVAEGGGNDILNLVTACIECNRGKGARKLSDDSVVKVRKAQLDQIAERRSQLEMMYEWQLELANDTIIKIDHISDLMGTLTGRVPNDAGRDIIKSWLSRFDYELVLEATRIAFTKYPCGNESEWAFAFHKIGGICFNKTHRTCGQCTHDVGYDSYTHLVECEFEHDGDYWVKNSHAEICPKFDRRFGG